MVRVVLLVLKVSMLMKVFVKEVCLLWLFLFDMMLVFSMGLMLC